MKFNRIKLVILALVMITTFLFTSAFINTSEAHILVIGDSQSDLNVTYDGAKNVSSTLKSKNYQVVELYRENATTKNILKGMYNADAVIYVGHGGDMGKYDMNGGNATPPYALVGSNDFIYGIGDNMREGYSGNQFKAPYKTGIPIIIASACFSTGRVEDKEVANPIPTIYYFSRMFTGSGANYYATTNPNPEIIYDFLNGAIDFADANNKNTEIITTSTIYNGTTIWRNPHGYAAFVGNWNGKFPTAAQTTPYDDAAAEKWYNSIVPDTTAPIITSSDPKNNALNVAINKVIKITFNEMLKWNKWIELKTSTGLSVGTSESMTSYKTFDSYGSLLTITPTALLATGTKYILALPTGCITDLRGNPLASTTITFTTTANTTLTIKYIDPPNGATNVARNKEIKITFNEPIKPGTGPNSMWIELKSSSGTLVKIYRIISGNTLTIKPATLLAPNTKYNLILHTGCVTNLAGDPFAYASSSFTTTSDSIAPIVKLFDPVNGATSVARNKQIKITFNEPIKTGNMWIELKSSSGALVKIYRIISGNTLTIKPATLLAPNTKYNLILHTGCVTDLAGNPLAIRSFSFTTGRT